MVDYWVLLKELKLDKLYSLLLVRGMREDYPWNCNYILNDGQ